MGIARTLPFGLALAAAVVFGAVPPWRGPGLVVLAVLAWFSPATWRVWLIAGGTAAVLQRGPTWIGVGLVLAMVLHDRKWEVVRKQAAGLLAVVTAILVLKQGVASLWTAAAIGVIPGLLWLGATSASAILLVSDTRRASGLLFLLGLVVWGKHFWLAHLAENGPVTSAAQTIAAHEAWSHWPTIEERAVEALDTSADTVIALSPERVRVGEAVARTHGVEVALNAGWDPQARVSEDLGIPLAWALEGQGRRTAARKVLGRQPSSPEVGLHRALFARMDGESVVLDDPPDEVREGPVIAGPEDLVDGTVSRSIFYLRTRVDTLRIAATPRPWLGSPVLGISINRLPWKQIVIDEERGDFSLPVSLEPGVNLLEMRLENDAVGRDGDRNLLGVSVRLPESSGGEDPL